MNSYLCSFLSCLSFLASPLASSSVVYASLHSLSIIFWPPFAFINSQWNKNHMTSKCWKLKHTSMKKAIFSVKHLCSSREAWWGKWFCFMNRMEKHNEKLHLHSLQYSQSIILHVTVPVYLSFCLLVIIIIIIFHLSYKYTWPQWIKNEIPQTHVHY